MTINQQRLPLDCSADVPSFVDRRETGTGIEGMKKVQLISREHRQNVEVSRWNKRAIASRDKHPKITVAQMGNMA